MENNYIEQRLKEFDDRFKEYFDIEEWRTDTFIKTRRPSVEEIKQFLSSSLKSLAEEMISEIPDEAMIESYTDADPIECRKLKQQLREKYVGK